MKAKLIILALTALSLVLIFWGIKSNSQLDLPAGDYIELFKTENTFPQLPIREPYKLEKESLNADWDIVNGTSVLAFNPVTSRTYYERNSDEKRAIASITKLMTSLVALDVYELDEQITLSKQIAIQDRSLNLEVGDRLEVSELLEAMLVASKNDAAEIIAQEYSKGYKGFIELMNKKAQFLGMENTHFSNASGFTDSDNYSTAQDLKVLAIAALSSDTLRKFAGQKSANFEYTRDEVNDSIVLASTNELFNVVRNVKGLKTGYTVKSGPSFIGYFSSSSEDQLVTILLDSTDRFEETRQLLNLIQENFSY